MMINALGDFVQPWLMPNAGTHERVGRFQLHLQGSRSGEHHVQIVGDASKTPTCWFALIADLLPISITGSDGCIF